MEETYPQIQGKTCLVTGATSGIGKATALGLARQGANVVIVARNQGKGEATRQEIQQLSGHSVDLLLADLSSQDSIRHLAATFIERYEHLHVLINNAGVFLARRQITVDGIEMNIAVNHLAPFLLTHLLLDKLRDSAPARIVNVNSGSHFSAKLNIQNFQLERGYNLWNAYAQSKLAGLLASYVLARKLTGTGITLNCLNPGFVFTNIGMDSVGPRSQNIAKAILSRLGSSPEKGARTSLYLAMSSEVANVTGKYYDKCVLKRTSAASYDETLQQWMWKESLRLTNITVD
jgi:NAD(P)-dependent dehydrogenase (short-subunit alcohol dehydrogenase family)